MPIEGRALRLMEHSDALWSKRKSLEFLWQEIAENFYPERADFTVQRYLGYEFASNLTTSFPILCRRDLGDSFATMLRPDKEWFEIHTMREDMEKNADKAWLQRAARIQRRAMYDRQTRFVRACREADHDYAAFGQACIQPSVASNGHTLLYQTHHLRDVVWTENDEGQIDTVYRKRKIFAYNAVKRFPKTASDKLQKLAKEHPYEEVELLHCWAPSQNYETAPGTGKKWGTPYVSVWLDKTNPTILEEIGVRVPMYLIPRWQTVSGSQYAYSPSTVAALPDGRLLQAITLTLLEAGEKFVNPPLVATENVVRSDINTYAGGTTWVDELYDEKLGEALRPLAQDRAGYPIGRDVNQDIRGILQQCFYLNKLRPFVPTDNPEMTAFQAGQIVQDYIRNALPLFEPMEIEYNGGICEMTFGLLDQHGAFGPPMARPPLLQKTPGIQFHFTSPLSQAIDAIKVQKLQQAKLLLSTVADLDPGAAKMLKARDALRDALNGGGTPATWLLDEDQMQQAADQAAQQEQAQKLLAGMGGAADVGLKIGQASQALKAGGVGPGNDVGAVPAAA